MTIRGRMEAGRQEKSGGGSPSCPPDPLFSKQPVRRPERHVKFWGPRARARVCVRGRARGRRRARAPVFAPAPTRAWKSSPPPTPKVRFGIPADSHGDFPCLSGLLTTLREIMAKIAQRFIAGKMVRRANQVPQGRKNRLCRPLRDFVHFTPQTQR